MPLRARWLVLAFGLALLSGCSQATMAPVKGRVVCDGKPVKQAAVTFSPVGKDETEREPGKPATGFTDAEGNYVLSTFKPYDGALIGGHRVTVSLDDTNPAPCKRSNQFTLEVKSGDNDLEIKLEKK